MTFYGYLLLALSAIYLVFELAFNARLLDIANIVPPMEMVHAYETYGRALSALGMALLALKLVPASKLTAVKTYSIALVVLGVTWFAGFHGQKMLVDHLVDQTTVEERMNAQYLALFKRGLATKSLQLHDIEVTEEQLDSPEFKTFISIIGLLTYFSDDVVDHFKGKTDEVLDRVADQEAAKRLPALYSDYQQAQTQIESAWARYDDAKSQYHAQTKNLRVEAEKAWNDMGQRLYNEYQVIAKKLSDAALAQKSVRLRNSLPDYYIDREKCEATNDRKCFERLSDYYDTRITDVVGKEMDPNFWCLGSKMTSITEFVNGRMKTERKRVYDCSPLTVTHLKKRLREALGHAESLQAFKEKPEVIDMVREELRKEGVTLPANWTLDDKEGFISAVIDQKGGGAREEFMRRTQEETGYAIPPGLNTAEFAKLPIVQDPLREALKVSDEGHFVRIDLAPDEFSATYVKPAILSKIDDEKRRFEENAQEFRDGGSREEDGKAYVTALIVPTVALSFSLLFGVLNFIGIVGTVLSKIIKAKWWVTLSVNGVLVAALFIAPVAYSVSLSQFQGLKIISDEFKKAQGSSAYYLTNWVINTEPRLYAIGSAASAIVPPIPYEEPEEAEDNIAQQSLDQPTRSESVLADNAEVSPRSESQTSGELSTASLDPEHDQIPAFTFPEAYLMLADEGSLNPAQTIPATAHIEQSLKAGADGVSLTVTNHDFDQWQISGQPLADFIARNKPLLQQGIVSFTLALPEHGFDRCMQLTPLIEQAEMLEAPEVHITSESLDAVECLGDEPRSFGIHYLHDPRGKEEISSLMAYRKIRENRKALRADAKKDSGDMFMHNRNVQQAVAERLQQWDFVDAIHLPVPVAKEMKDDSNPAVEGMMQRPIYLVSEGERSIEGFPTRDTNVKGVIGKLL